MNKKQSITENATAIFLGTFLNVLISVVTTPIITRLVAPEDYGQWSLFQTYGNVIIAFVMLGMDHAFVRFYYKDERLVYKRYLVAIAVKIPVSLCIASIIFTIGFIRKLQLFNQNSWTIYILLYLYVIGYVFNRIAELVIRMEQRGKEYSFLIVFNKIAYLLILFTLIYGPSVRDVIALTSATVFSQFLVASIAIILGRSHWNLFQKTPEKSPITSQMLILYGLPFVYSYFANDIFDFADKWFIKGLKTYSDVGIYAAASSIVGICSIVQSTFCTLWAPIAMKQYESSPENTSVFVNANAAITIIMFLMGSSVVCFKDVIIYLLGSQYRLASTVIPFLIFKPIMMTISETTVYGLNFKNKTWLHMVITSVAAFVNVVLNYLLVPYYSSEGAAIATGISYIIFFIMRTVLAGKCYPVNFPLKCFSVITLMFFLYSGINTFYHIPFLWNFVLFIIFNAVLLVVYRKFLTILIRTVKNEIQKKLLR